MSKHNLTIFDDLLAPARAMEIRNQVLAEGFKTLKGPDGFDYTGTNLTKFPEIPTAIAGALGRNIAVSLECFRFHLAGDKPHSYVHSDETVASHAAVYYLNPPHQCQGGTAFWEHKGMGLEEMPSDSELERGQWKPDWFKPMMEAEWKKKKAWKQKSLAAMKFNRFIIYRTALFHSRWPIEAFGDSPENGRLVWVCFFDFTMAPPTAPKPTEAEVAVNPDPNAVGQTSTPV
jgi:Family of unknown function (DUF6445)